MNTHNPTAEPYVPAIDLRLATRQEVFEFVTKFLIAQGKPSRASDGKCAYRGVEGRMCAVGCLLPDEDYHKSMENKPVEFLIMRHRRDYLLPHGFLLEMLQLAHDKACLGDDARDWLPKFIREAEVEGRAIRLDTAFLKELQG